MTAGERLRRLEWALAEGMYMTHGVHGMPSLRRQAPHLAAIVEEWLAGTLPRDDTTFVGRQPQETTERKAPREER